MEKEINLIEWCRKEIVPKIVDNFKVTWEDIELEIREPKNVYYLSSVYFVDIKIKKENKFIHAVVKKPNNNEMINKNLTIAEQFHNEVLFYKKIANNSKQYPKCFYAYESQEKYQDGLIIMENIASLGYKLCPSLYDIPFEYVISGVKEIGRFHGMSYAMKSHDPINFFNIVNEIKISTVLLSNFYPTYMNLILQRPIKWLRKNNYDSKFCDKMEYYMKNAFKYFIVDTLEPIEPLAVFCHGDFTRNNILYRKKNNFLESKLIDFAMMRYASPCTDLALFLFYSVSKNDRKKRFNEIFTAYHQSLIKYLKDENVKILDCYSYDNFLADFKQRVMFGYMMGIFFLPDIYGQGSLIDACFNCDFDPAKTFNLFEDVGGEEISKIFAEMLIEVREMGGLNIILSD